MSLRYMDKHNASHQYWKAPRCPISMRIYNYILTPNGKAANKEMKDI